MATHAPAPLSKFCSQHRMKISDLSTYSWRKNCKLIPADSVREITGFPAFCNTIETPLRK
jgi:hypothetical protein